MDGPGFVLPYGEERSPALPDIRAAHQIVQTDIEEVSDGDQAVEVRKALIQFIALIGPIPNNEYALKANILYVG